VHTLAPLAAIAGNNYSVFLIERGSDGHLHLRGGAGGAAAGGGTFGLWAPAGLILIPSAILVWYLTGYASITTLSIGLLAILILGTRAALGLAPWEYVLYGVITEAMLIWALRPNIKRLMDGTERRHGLPVLLQKRKEHRLKAKSGETKDRKE
jgi:glycerol-3-phosphate acyltransferase PlsY